MGARASRGTSLGVLRSVRRHRTMRHLIGGCTASAAAAEQRRSDDTTLRYAADRSRRRHCRSSSETDVLARTGRRCRHCEDDAPGLRAGLHCYNQHLVVLHPPFCCLPPPPTASKFLRPGSQPQREPTRGKLIVDGYSFEVAASNV
ncbi:hypothetical protein HPB48_019749 [Haemaphysalis longicornis]|uniref:Uncharacterized protein n=1 Tax=Haemaphysalis longicornis TaxID=44386 RepID=A0A9J6FL23_HAELO|nr:hypothetical protein HPB48_019749 [Haemaphysalis longicornis]